MRRKQKGQTLVEMALLLPLLLTLSLGAFDISRALSLSISNTSEARAGMRMGIKDPYTDIGYAIRTDAFNNYIVNTDWGIEQAGQSEALCTGNAPSCGDPQGCVSASSFWATKVGGILPKACFAIRTCKNYSNGTCPPLNWSTWGSSGARPIANSTNNALEVVVVYKYKALFPFFSAMSGGATYIQDSAIGPPLY